MKCFVAVLFLIVSLPFCSSQTIIINEIMSKNDFLVADENGDCGDWIEVYNASQSPVCLQGFCLSDQTETSELWSFPDTCMEPKTFLLVYASGKNRAISGHELHTNFKISAEGEPILLSYYGNIIDMVPPRPLQQGNSFGRRTDAGHTWAIFENPTPCCSNNNALNGSELIFDIEGGYFEQDFQLHIINNIPNTSIYYSINGNIPDTDATLYKNAISITRNNMADAFISTLQNTTDAQFFTPERENIPQIHVIRAAAFNSQGEQCSRVYTHSYIPRNSPTYSDTLPVMSICAQNHDLFDFEKGIFVPGIHWETENPDWTGNYYQHGDDWEIEVHIEFFEHDGAAILSHNAGMRTHGGNSRRNQQKGLKLYARAEYGRKKFYHNIFPEKSIYEFDRWVLKPMSASWNQSGIEDYVACKMAGKLNVDYISTRPVILYINGEYWGLYYLQEKPDEKYIAENYKLDSDSIDMIESMYAHVVAGDNSDFQQLYNFIETHDLSDESDYRYVESQIDIDNFIDYQLFEIFIANYDWPDNNMRCWRSKQEGSKWRWIFFDGDAAFNNSQYDSFAHALNTSDEGWPTNAASTLFLRKLLSNSDFRRLFSDRLKYVTLNTFHYRNTEAIFQQALEWAGSEIINQINRFAFPQSYEIWSDKTMVVRDFLVDRRCNIEKMARKNLGISINPGDCTFENAIIDNITISPNPSYNEFSIEFYLSKSYPVTLTVCDLTGTIIDVTHHFCLQGSNSIKVDDISLYPGMYIVYVFADNQAFSTKLLVISD